MNIVLRDILRSRQTLLPSGQTTEATSYIDEQCGNLLQELIREIRPKVGVEVGLAFGISTLFILEALAESGGQKLIGIDPAQHDDWWRGGGLFNIERAGFQHLYEFHENTSQQVLPALVGKGEKVDFAFIDGWHTFDHTLIDFFYIDQMLSVGGVVVFDDVGYPAIRRVCDFVLTNRSYQIRGAIRLNTPNGFSRRAKAQVNKLLEPLVRTDKTPGIEAKGAEFQISDVYFLALTKVDSDNRRWDHFVHF